MAALLFEEIAANLILQIRDGSISAGDKLPSERTMAEQFGVSRNVIREAIRVLSEKGYVRVNTGRGAFICMPDGEKLTENLSVIVEHSSASPVEIAESREVFESALAELACERAEKDDIDLLRTLCRQMEETEDSAKFARLDRQFHLSFAACTHNSVLILLAGSIYQLSENSLFPLAPRKVKWVVRAIHEHRDMVSALERRDPQGIRVAVRSHIDCIRGKLASIGDQIDKK